MNQHHHQQQRPQQRPARLRRWLGAAALTALTVAIFSVSFVQSMVYTLRTDTLSRGARLPAAVRRRLVEQCWVPTVKALTRLHARTWTMTIQTVHALHSTLSQLYPVRLVVRLRAQLLAQSNRLRLTEMLYSVLAMSIVCAMVVVRCVVVVATQLWQMCHDSAAPAMASEQASASRRARQRRSMHKAFASSGVKSGFDNGAGNGHDHTDNSNSMNTRAGTWHDNMARHSAHLTQPVMSASLASTVAAETVDADEEQHSRGAFIHSKAQSPRRRPVQTRPSVLDVFDFPATAAAHSVDQRSSQ